MERYKDIEIGGGRGSHWYRDKKKKREERDKEIEIQKDKRQA